MGLGLLLPEPGNQLAKVQEVPVEALQGLRIAARGWRASRLPRVGFYGKDNPARVAQIRVPVVAPIRRNPGL